MKGVAPEAAAAMHSGGQRPQVVWQKSPSVIHDSSHFPKSLRDFMWVLRVSEHARQD